MALRAKERRRGVISRSDRELGMVKRRGRPRRSRMTLRAGRRITGRGMPRIGSRIIIRRVARVAVRRRRCGVTVRVALVA